jgi:integrase/recombinase XerD
VLWMRETIASFQSHISKTKSPLTVEAYVTDISLLFDWLAKHGGRRMKGLTKAKIKEYLDHCAEEGRSDATIHRRFIAIKGFCKHLKREYAHIIVWDEEDRVKAPKRKELRLPTRDQIGAFLDSISQEDEWGHRDRAMLELMYSSGLRASEVCNLEMDDINLANRTLRIRNGKGDKSRIVPITQRAYNALLKYVNIIDTDERVLVFSSTVRHKVTRQCLGQIVSKYAQANDMEVTPHTLRHCCASHLIWAGADSAFVQKLLGHSSIITTQHYMHFNTVDLKNMLEKYHK